MESIYLLRVQFGTKLGEFRIDDILRVSRAQEDESYETPFPKPWWEG